MINLGEAYRKLIEKTVRAARADKQKTVRAARADREKTNNERTMNGASRTGR